MEEPKYLKLYNHLLSRIQSGELTYGSTVETEMELTQQFEVSRVTVRKAMELLVEEGYLTRIRGKGTIVSYSGSSGSHPLPLQSTSRRFRQKQKFIGFILPDISSSFGIKIMEGIEKEAEKLGYYLVMKLTKGKQDLEEKAIRDLISLGASGLIIQPQHDEFFNPAIMELSMKGFPFVLVDLELRGLKSSFIGTDHKEASYKGASYLLDKGHRRILYLSPPVRNTSALEDRLDGVKAAILDYNLPIDDSLFLLDFVSTMPGRNTPGNIETDKNLLLDHLTAERGITAIFACEYHLAILASHVLKEIGLQIPGDVSLLCFDAPWEYIGESAYTHLKQNEFEMGILAMEKLNRVIEGDQEIERIVLSASLVEGDTIKEI